MGLVICLVPECAWTWTKQLAAQSEENRGRIPLVGRSMSTLSGMLVEEWEHSCSHPATDVPVDCRSFSRMVGGDAMEVLFRFVVSGFFHVVIVVEEDGSGYWRLVVVGGDCLDVNLCHGRRNENL